MNCGAPTFYGQFKGAASAHEHSQIGSLLITVRFVLRYRTIVSCLGITWISDMSSPIRRLSSSNLRFAGDSPRSNKS
jgi:hypothetical protein